MSLKQCFRQYVLRWLGLSGIEKENRDLAEQLGRLRQSCSELQVSTYKELSTLLSSLNAQSDLFKQELESALADQRLALKTEFDVRIGCVLDASISASEKIARMVANQGDINIKEYVDSCLSVFVSTYKGVEQPFE